MKRYKTLLAVICGAIIIAACNIIPGIGGESAKAPAIKELEPEPTESTLSESVHKRFDLEKDINKDWGLLVVSGLEDQLIWTQNNGKFRVQILPPNDTNFVFLNKNTSYEDVVVQAEVENFGQLDVAFSLICRASDAGWYEFRISPQGYYELLRYDEYKRKEGKNTYTNFAERRIVSSYIKGGLDTNVFSLSCAGDQIKGFINGEEIYKDKRPLTIEDTTYSSGTFGFGVLGYGKEVDMTFNRIETLKPE